jgi:hypothetical protein
MTDRPRPTPELLAALREGKRQLHQQQRELSLPEKVRQLIELQKIDFAIRTARGEKLESWQRPWDIES